jgi:hypothetical protein
VKWQGFGNLVRNKYALAALVLILTTGPTLLLDWYLPLGTRPSLVVLAILSFIIADVCLLAMDRVPGVRGRVLLWAASLGLYLPPPIIVLHLRLWIGGAVGLILWFVFFLYLARRQLR